MNLNIFLDVAISVVFVFLLFSIIVTGINELWQTIFRSRGHQLYDALLEVFNDRLNKDYTGLLYTHPLIDSLKQSSRSYPSYIQSKIFADAVIDFFSTQTKLPEFSFDKQKGVYKISRPDLGTYENVNEKSDYYLELFKSGVDTLNHSDLKVLLNSFCVGAKTVGDLRSNIIFWYDEYMNVVSSWYKRKVMFRSIVFGILIAIAGNVDCIHLSRKLYEDEQLRNQVVLAATNYYETHKQDRPIVEDTNSQNDISDEIDKIRDAYNQVGLLKLPIGWYCRNNETVDKETNSSDLQSNPALMLLGWLISGFAFAFGSDYWFNLLGKLINIRGSVKPKEGDEKSKA